MNRNGVAAVASLIILLSSVSRAEDGKTQYSSAAPLDQYLMTHRAPK